MSDRFSGAATAGGYDRAFGHVSREFVPTLLRAARVAPGQWVLDIATGTGAAAEAAAAFEQPIRYEDLREDAHRSLMRCYLQLGQRGRALRQYEQLSALLAEELDAKPELETRRLFESIRQALPA